MRAMHLDDFFQIGSRFIVLVFDMKDQGPVVQRHRFQGLIGGRMVDRLGVGVDGSLVVFFFSLGQKRISWEFVSDVLCQLP